MRASVKIGLVLIACAILIGGSILARKSHSDEDVWLGISHQSVSYRLAKKLDLPVKSGVLVERVYRKSPAKEAGLKRGDVITAVDGNEITDADDLMDIIFDHEVGDKIKLTVVNEDGENNITAKLEETPHRYQSGRSFKRGVTIFSDDDDDFDFNFDFDSDHDNNWGYSGRYYERPFLGVVLQELTRQLGDYFGVKRGRGALITEVVEDSPAETAGLKAGDVIISINGSKVRDTEDAVDEIHDGEIGDKISIVIMRDRKEMTIEAELDESDDSYGGNNFWFGDDDVHIGHILDMPAMPALPSLSGFSNRYHSDCSHEDIEDIIDIDDIEDIRELQMIVPGLQRIFSENIRMTGQHSTREFKQDMNELQRELREMQYELQTELQDELQDMKIELKSSRML